MARQVGEKRPLVHLDRIGRTYRGPSEEVVALSEVSLSIDPGEFVCITGPSGSGKSTLLHLLGLLDHPTAGRYVLGGEDVSHLDDRERTLRRNRDLGFVFQAFHLIPHLTVLENVALPLRYARVAVRERLDRSREALDRIGLASRAAHRPEELSGGEQQRVAIARASVVQPLLLLADEPTGNLDDATAEDVLSSFEEIRRRGTTIVVVTHSREIASAGSRRVDLREGRVL